MPASLFQYEMLATTWVFVSALMTVAIFFKFHRMWSVRNLDLIALILSGVGLIDVAMNEQRLGFLWMVSLCVLFMVRMLFDTIMVRRPLLEPNLTPGGLVFASVALLAFLVTAASVNHGTRVDSLRAVRLDQVLTARSEATRRDGVLEPLPFPARPGLPLFHDFCRRVDRLLAPSPELQRAVVAVPRDATTAPPPSPLVVPMVLPDLSSPPRETHDAPSDTLTEAAATDLSAPSPPLPPPSLLSFESSSDASVGDANNSLVLMAGLLLVAASHALIAIGLVVIGGRHFGSLTTGIASAVLYLLLPYTHQMVGRIDHFLPAALIVWAVFFYRRPLIAGFLLGLAGGLVFYPVFLIPLWCAFYASRGWSRFVGGLAIAAGVVVGVVASFPSFPPMAWGDALWSLAGFPAFAGETRDGLWLYVNPLYRIPVMAAFGAMGAGLAIWPSHKHLGTLLCCSTLVLLGVQCWQPLEGGLTLGWFLPTMILTFFRPNLEDRTAAAVY